MLLPYLFLMSTMVTTSWTFMCPEPYVCACQEIIFNCTCKSRQNITITSIYNFEIRHVLVDGCGTVRIPMGSMFHLHLESVELNDLERLHIDPFALAGLQTIEILRISNVQNMDVERRGFSGLFNISTVSISNVSWEDMRAESFGGVSSTENFIITDSKFGIVESLAFILQNITKFSVQNSDFGTVENMSLLIHGSKEVSFEDCTFQDASYTAFSMSFVETLSFQRCSFDVLAKSAFFAKNVDSFELNNCSVNALETHAFKNVEAVKHIRFANNIVNLAEEDSLYLSTVNSESKNTEIIISGNKLTCDCNLAWLWKTQMDVYKDFIESSFCIGSSDSLRVSSVSSRIGSESESCNLNSTSSQADENETNYTLSETNYTLTETNETLTETKILNRISISSTAGKENLDFFVVACCCAMLVWK